MSELKDQPKKRDQWSSLLEELGVDSQVSAEIKQPTEAVSERISTAASETVSYSESKTVSESFGSQIESQTAGTSEVRKDATPPKTEKFGAGLLPPGASLSGPSQMIPPASAGSKRSSKASFFNRITSINFFGSTSPEKVDRSAAVPTATAPQPATAAQPPVATPTISELDVKTQAETAQTDTVKTDVVQANVQQAETPHNGFAAKLHKGAKKTEKASDSSAETEKTVTAETIIAAPKGISEATTSVSPAITAESLKPRKLDKAKPHSADKMGPKTREVPPSAFPAAAVDPWSRLAAQLGIKNEEKAAASSVHETETETTSRVAATAVSVDLSEQTKESLTCKETKLTEDHAESMETSVSSSSDNSFDEIPDIESLVSFRDLPPRKKPSYMLPEPQTASKPKEIKEPRAFSEVTKEKETESAFPQREKSRGKRHENGNFEGKERSDSEKERFGRERGGKPERPTERTEKSERREKGRGYTDSRQASFGAIEDDVLDPAKPAESFQPLDASRAREPRDANFDSRKRGGKPSRSIKMEVGYSETYDEPRKQEIAAKPFDEEPLDSVDVSSHSDHEYTDSTRKGRNRKHRSRRERQANTSFTEVDFDDVMPPNEDYFEDDQDVTVKVPERNYGPSRDVFADLFPEEPNGKTAARQVESPRQDNARGSSVTPKKGEHLSRGSRYRGAVAEPAAEFEDQGTRINAAFDASNDEIGWSAPAKKSSRGSRYEKPEQPRRVEHDIRTEYDNDIDSVFDGNDEIFDSGSHQSAEKRNKPKERKDRDNERELTNARNKKEREDTRKKDKAYSGKTQNADVEVDSLDESDSNVDEIMQLHKSIPSWDDAVLPLVESNITRHGVKRNDSKRR
ncbi:MAG: hypothetical protein ACRC2T_07005 [Thermoguttaceae bacterium]